ncbi:MAG TPA: hypothetical protein VJ803_08365 [Gemmatimonadaceae bacterium]|jgi:hypothetical protein|nr:hypothetical protein [Gemmatimonadaceae bacterium]
MTRPAARETPARKPFVAPEVREHPRMTDLTQVVAISGQVPD